MPNELKIGRVYRHFKGDFYLVEAVANDSETGEPFVVYRRALAAAPCHVPQPRGQGKIPRCRAGISL